MTLPIVRASELPMQLEEKRWLVEELWGEQAVGIIGGEPKCGKSILALSLAVAVAGGLPCLGRFAVKNPGRVLLFAAEDPPHIVRARLDAIALAHGVQLADLDIQVITRDILRLDLEQDYALLLAAIQKLSPRLLILDPFVRLHQVDENSSAEVAPILGRLRAVQRNHHAAVILVHHARKDAGNVRAGQALRGSSEFHAWGDSNLYLRRTKDGRITLGVEHRAERAIPQLTLELSSNEIGPYHQIVEAERPPDDPLTRSPSALILDALRSSASPMQLKEIRQTTRLRTETVSLSLRELVSQGDVARTTAGFSLHR